MRRIMAKVVAATAGVTTVVGLSLVGGASAWAYQPVQHNLYAAQNPSSCNKSPCILYPKSTELPNGRLVAGFEDSEGPVVGQTLPIYKSDDNGDSWQKLTDVQPPASLSSDPAYAPYTSNWTNPYLYVLPQDLGSLKAGTLLLADVVSGADTATSGSQNRATLAIALYASTDDGQAWNMVNLIATGPNEMKDPVWEPYLMMFQGQLVAYYSDENDYLSYDPSTGVPALDPDNTTATDSGGQILAHRTWNGSDSWSAPVVDVAGYTQNMGGGKTEIGGGRPGMTNVVPTTDGKWMLTYEYWGGGDNVRYKIASNPLQFFADNSAAGSGISTLPVTSSNRLAQGGSPVMERLPGGQIVYNAAGSGDVWVNASGSSTGTWKQYHTSVAAGYSRDLQYVSATGRLEIIQAPWGTGPVHYGQVDLGHSAGAYYSIVNRKTGQILSTAADKTQDASFAGNVPDIISWNDNPANDSQRWHVISKGSSVTLLNKAGGRSIGIWQGNASPGMQLAQWVDDGGSDKLWNLVPTTDGYYKFQSARNTSLYMSGAAASGVVNLGTAIDTSTDPTADYAEQWKLVQQAPVAADLTSESQLAGLVIAAPVGVGATVELNAASFTPDGSATHANTSGHAYAFGSDGTVTDLGGVSFDADQKGSVILPDSFAVGSQLRIAVLFDTTALVWDSTTVLPVPQVTATVTGFAPNAEGWRNGPATVTLSLNEGAQAAIQYRLDAGEWQAYTGPVEIAQDGETTLGYQAVANGAPVEDSGGVETLDIDQAAPTVSLAGGPSGSYSFGHDPAAPSCLATDATSGVASCLVTGGGTSVGAHSYLATATDHAGNVSTAELDYTVLPWTLTGFASPVSGAWNTVKAGTTVPLKFQIFDGNVQLTDVSSVQGFAAVTVPCPGSSAPTSDVPFVTTGGTSLRYSDGSFVQNWATPKTPGACVRVTATADDGSALAANFILR